MAKGKYVTCRCRMYVLIVGGTGGWAGGLYYDNENPFDGFFFGIVLTRMQPFLWLVELSLSNTLSSLVINHFHFPILVVFFYTFYHRRKEAYQNYSIKLPFQQPKPNQTKLLLILWIPARPQCSFRLWQVFSLRLKSFTAHVSFYSWRVWIKSLKNCTFVVFIVWRRIKILELVYSCCDRKKLWVHIFCRPRYQRRENKISWF